MPVTTTMNPTSAMPISHYCYIIPPHMLRAIVHSQEASQNSRDVAKKTLGKIAAIRQARVQTQTSFTTGQAHRRPQGIVPGHVFQAVLKSDSASEESKERAKEHLASMSKVKEAKVLPTSTEARPRPMHLFRILYDSQ